MAGPDVSGDELDLLADLDAGLLEGAERDRAEALARTDRGRAVLAALGQVRGDLAALPDPEVPPELAARLRAVLTAAVSDRADPGSPDSTPLNRPVEGASDPGTDGSSGAPVADPGGGGATAPEVPVAVAPRAGSGRTRRRRSRDAVRRRWTWAAGAAAAGVALGAVVVTGALRPRTPDADRLAATSGAATRTGPAAEQAAAPAADAAVAGADGSASGSGTGPVLASGRDYTAADLPGAALALTTRSGPTGGAPRLGALAATPPDLARLRDPAELAGCLASLAGAPVEALVVDLAHVEGASAVVAVLPGPDGEPVVHVGGARCSRDDPDRLAFSAS